MGGLQEFSRKISRQVHGNGGEEEAVRGSQGIRDVVETHSARRQGGSLEGVGVYVGREPGRLVISPGGVISWMQLPSRPPTPLATRQKARRRARDGERENASNARQRGEVGLEGVEGRAFEGARYLPPLERWL